MAISVILDDKLATSGIDYNYDYLLKGNYQSNEKTEDSWKVVDVRRLRDSDSNSLEDYQKYIDLSYETIKEYGRVVICCSYGISRSNAIALGVLVKHYDMTFLDAQRLIKQKVEKSDIVQAHIDKLQKLLIR